MSPDNPDDTATATVERFAKGLLRGKQSWALKINAPVRSLCTHGEFLIASCRDGSIMSFRVCGSEPHAVDSLRIGRSALCIAAHDRWLYVGTGGTDVEAYAFDGEAGCFACGADAQPTMRLEGHARSVTALCCTHENIHGPLQMGACVISSANDLSVRLWDAETGGALATLVEGVEAASSLCYADGVLLLCGHCAGAGSISLWERPSAGKLMQRARQRARDWCVAPPLSAVLADGSKAFKAAAAARAAEAARKRDLTCVHTFATGENSVHTAVLACAGAAALSASHSGEVQVWDLRARRLSSQQTTEVWHHERPLTALALLESDGVVCSASSDGMLRATWLLRADDEAAGAEEENARPTLEAGWADTGL